MKRKAIFLILLFVLTLMLMVFMPKEAMAADVIGEFIIDDTTLFPYPEQEPQLYTLSGTEIYTIKEQSWTDKDGNTLTKFISGEICKFKMVLEPKDGYELRLENLQEINTVKWTSSTRQLWPDGTVSYEVEGIVPYLYTITVQTTAGVTVTPNGTTTVYQGYDKEFTITPDENYQIDSVKVNGVQTTLLTDKLEIKDIQENIKIEIETSKVIKYVELTGMTLPIVGNLPDTSGIKAPEGAKYIVTGVSWYVYELDENGWPTEILRKMNDGETFVAGQYYKLEVEIEAIEDKFANQLGATIDGIGASVGTSTDGTFIVLDYFGPLVEFKFVDNTANQIYTIGEVKTLTFKLEADNEVAFLEEGKVYIDNVLIDAKNYTFEAGNKTITLTEEFMKTLSLGTHKIRVVFFDMLVAETTFTVEEGKDNSIIGDIVVQPTPEEDNNKTNINASNENSTTTKNPQTGDTIIFYLIVFVISVIGILYTKCALSSYTNKNR